MINALHRRWQRASLVEQLTIKAVTFTLFVTIVGTSSFVWRVYQQQEADLLMRLQTKIDLYAETLAAPVWSLQTARVTELLKAVDVVPELVVVRVIDDLGATLAELNRGGLDTANLGDNYRLIQQELVYQTISVGRIEAWVSTEELTAMLRARSLEAVWGLLLLTILLTLILRMTLSKFSQRLGSISRSFEALSSGQLDISLHIPRDQGELGTLAKAFDVSQENLVARRDAELEMRYLAEHDPLTGLANRFSLLNHATKVLKDCLADETICAFLIIDLDEFKGVNDSLGHSAGDELLKSIAQRIRRISRESDFAARLGGDEFAIILGRIGGRHTIESTVARLHKELVAPYEIAHRLYPATVSMGVAIFPDHGVCYDELMRHADLALYSAKTSKPAVQIYGSELSEAQKRRKEVEKALRDALRMDGFHLVYQPQVCVRSGKLIGAEALLRFEHEDMGIISPLEIVDVAEDCGLIHEIGRWVLRNAAAQMVEWRHADFVIDRMAVNLSPSEFLGETFLQDFSSDLQKVNCPPGWIEIEITEHVLMTQPGKVASTMQALRDKDVSIAIDDFGSGYSSLSYLKRLPASLLKIDRCFVSDLANDKSDLILVETILAMARRFSLKALAEGVETEEQLTLLRNIGCEMAQGYHIAKPMNARAFEAWAAQRTVVTPTLETASL